MSGVGRRLLYSRDNAKYPYEPLDAQKRQIRLFTLEPAPDKDLIIRGRRLHLVDLPENCRTTSEDEGGDAVDLPVPFYEALSYTWGDDAKSHVILLDHKRFYVTSNLSVALEWLRHTSEPRVMWIDAICINQSNVEEINDQVRFMRDIYFHASDVVVWLGVPKSYNRADIDEAIDEIRNLRQVSAGNWRGIATLEKYQSLDHSFTTEGMRRRAMPIGTLDLSISRHKRILGVFGDIVYSSWWWRMWTIQELFASSKGPIFYYGSSRISWNAMLKGIYVLVWEVGLEDCSVYLSMKDGANLHTFLIYREFNPTRRLADLILATRGRGATDPRDQIFSLIGMCSPEDQSEYTIDYGRSVRSLYEATTADILNAHNNLDLLIAAPGKVLRGLPSWCVDFSKPDWKVDSLIIGGGDLWCAKHLTIHNDVESSIVVHGTVIGTFCISQALPPLQVEDDIISRLVALSDFAARVHSCWRDLPDIAEKLANIVSGGEIIEAIAGMELSVNDYCRMNLDTTDSGGPVLFETWSDIQAFADSLLKQRLSHDRTDFKIPDSLSEPEKRKFKILLDVLDISENFTLIATNSGNMVCADATWAKEGDSLCRLAGCSRPAILRSRSDDKFELITFANTPRLAEHGDVCAHSELREFKLV